MKIGRESVGDVDAARGDARQFDAEGHFGLGFDMAALGGLDELALRVIGAFRSALKQRQPRRGTADRPAEVNAIAAPSAAAKNRLTRFADQRDGNEKMFGAREIAADDLDVVLFRRDGQLLDDCRRIVLGGRSDRDDRVPRPPAHRRDVGEIDRETFPRDETQRDRAREVDVLDEHVVGDDLTSDDCRIVAGARKKLANAGNQIAFAHRLITGTIGSNGRSNVSPRYVTASRKSPDGGAVGSTFAAFASSLAAISSGVAFPRPTSTRNAVSLRTIFHRKCEASMRKRIRSPLATAWHRSTTTMRDSSSFSRLSLNALKSWRPSSSAAARDIVLISSRSLIHQTNGLANAVRRVAIW